MASWAWGEEVLGTVMAKMAPLSGRVIRSGERMAMRSMVMKAAISGGKPAARAAAMGMVGNAMGMGALKGAALMGGLNMGRQIISNGLNGQSLGSGVGTAGFRGAALGAVGGAAYGGFSGVFGANSGAWGAFEKAHVNGDLAEVAKRAVMKGPSRASRRLGGALAKTGWGTMGGGYRGFSAASAPAAAPSAAGMSPNVRILSAEERAARASARMGAANAARFGATQGGAATVTSAANAEAARVAESRSRAYAAEQARAPVGATFRAKQMGTPLRSSAAITLSRPPTAAEIEYTRRHAIAMEHINAALGM